MGAGNHSYVDKKTGALVTASRITRINLKACRAIASIRLTGDEKNESYAVSGLDGDISANPGDWVVKTAPQEKHPIGGCAVMSHADFAAAHRPAG